ncbi:MAG: FHA domain-containing protein [Microbacterium sp.]
MTTTDQTRSAHVDPLVLTRPARAGQRAGAFAVDALIPLALAAASAILYAVGAPGFGSFLALLTLGAILTPFVMLARDGRSLGSAAAGTRTVVRTTGVAAQASLIPALFSGRLVTVDLVRGRDPFAPALSPFEFPVPAPEQAAPTLPLRGQTPIVELDSGERLPLDAALILGRNPAAPADAPATVYQWPDLSRTLSKSHARLEWNGKSVWVTDLGSTNGTLLRADGRTQALVPFQRTPLPPDAILELGDRVVTVVTAT